MVRSTLATEFFFTKHTKNLSTKKSFFIPEGTNALHSSLNSLDAAGGVYSEIANSIILASTSQRVNGGLVQQQPGLTESGRDSRSQGAAATSGSLLQSIHQGL